MGLFIEHVNTVLAKLREQPITALSTDTTTEAFRAQVAVRRAVSRIWNAKQWSFKIQTHTLTTVSGQLQYVLPSTVGEIFSVLSDTSPYTISVLPENKFDEYVPHPIESANPRFLRLFGSSSIIAQPSASGVVQVSSSSSNDTTQTVLVKGLIGGSYVDYEELTLAGTGTVSGSKTFSSLLSITKSGQTNGLITAVVGSDTVGQLWPQETVHRGLILRFFPTPDAAYAIVIKHFGMAPYLTQAYEDVEIPGRWDYVVDQFAWALALQSKGQEQMEEFKTHFDVATKFLETDMASEEFIAAEEIITPSRFGFIPGGVRWDNTPTNYNYPSF